MRDHMDDRQRAIQMVNAVGYAPASVRISSRKNYGACQRGPCKGGTKLCPSPAACQLLEPLTPRARAWRGIALLGLAIVMALLAWWLS